MCDEAPESCPVGWLVVRVATGSAVFDGGFVAIDEWNFPTVGWVLELDGVTLFQKVLQDTCKVK